MLAVFDSYVDIRILAFSDRNVDISPNCSRTLSTSRLSAKVLAVGYILT